MKDEKKRAPLGPTGRGLAGWARRAPWRAEPGGGRPRRPWWGWPAWTLPPDHPDPLAHRGPTREEVDVLVLSLV